MKECFRGQMSSSTPIKALILLFGVISCNQFVVFWKECESETHFETILLKGNQTGITSLPLLRKLLVFCGAGLLATHSNSVHRFGLLASSGFRGGSFCGCLLFLLRRASAAVAIVCNFRRTRRKRFEVGGVLNFLSPFPVSRWYGERNYFEHYDENCGSFATLF